MPPAGCFRYDPVMPRQPAVRQPATDHISADRLAQPADARGTVHPKPGVEQEVLDYFIVFGERHMNHLCSEFLAHYHEERPHQGKENGLLVRVDPAEARKAGRRGKRTKQPPAAASVSQIRCRERLGGLLKHYHRKAA